MKYFIDTEFLEDGRTIDLLSIAIVAEDGREYYAVNLDADWERAVNDKWLRTNVFPGLPVDVHKHLNGDGFIPSKSNDQRELWKTRQQIAREILEFVGKGLDKPEFWGYYADYDWVALCQLYGRMIDLPPGWPMYMRDLKQLADQYVLKLPRQVAGEHNALEDARWTKHAFEAAVADIRKLTLR